LLRGGALISSKGRGSQRIEKSTEPERKGETSAESFLLEKSLRVFIKRGGNTWVTKVEKRLLVKKKNEKRLGTLGVREGVVLHRTRKDRAVRKDHA